MTLDCHCHMARPLSRYVVAPLCLSFVAAPIGEVVFSNVRLWYSRPTSTVELGFISNVTPPPKPMIFRCRLAEVAVGGNPAEGSNLSVVWTPGALTSSAQNERFSRRPRLIVPILRPHMTSNSSLLFVFGSTE